MSVPDPAAMPTAISLFSGAGGLDHGFREAGFRILWANEKNKNAASTYRANFGDHLHEGDINNFLDDLKKLSRNREIDCVFGGPPCQGLSVAGKQDKNDPRNKLIATFHNVVINVQPKIFLMENVPNLQKKFNALLRDICLKFEAAGYKVVSVIANARDHNVPQSRERLFLFGYSDKLNVDGDFIKRHLEEQKSRGQTCGEVLRGLLRVNTNENPLTCKAKIKMCEEPILRGTAYSGMLFNGRGRPLKLNEVCQTLPASIGGNKTPIVDDEEVYNREQNWAEIHYENVKKRRREDWGYTEVPSRLRRITVREAAALQTFPRDCRFNGPPTSQYTQIGNAVPCNLAFSVAKVCRALLENVSGCQRE